MKGKVLAGSRGDHYLLCFRGDQCVCKPLLHLLYFNGFETENQAGLCQKAERQRADLLPGRKDPLSLLFFLAALTVPGGGGKKTTQISTIDSAGSLQCISLPSPLWSLERGAAAKNQQRGNATRRGPLVRLQAIFRLVRMRLFEPKALGQLPSAPDIHP